MDNTVFIIYFSVLLGNAIISVSGYPLHASCTITWTLSDSCDKVASQLVNQIEIWGANQDCGTGQKCLYDKTSLNGNILKATHTTPVRRYIDDLTFTFKPNTKTSGCNVVGFSTSRIWYAVLDFGTNYCNLHNLIDGAELTKDSTYTESTSNRVCTQFTSADCEKY